MSHSPILTSDRFHSYIALSRRALRHNIETLRTRMGGDCRIALPVKSNAYGHGVKTVITAVDDCIDRYLVDDSLELVEVRALTKKPIELLGYVSPEELDQVAAARGVISLFDEPHARACEEWARAHQCTLQVSLAVDLRFGREGVPVERAPALIQYLQSSPHLSPQGVYGHFSSADADPDLTISREQLGLLESILAAGGDQDINAHLFASSGIWAFDAHQPFNRVVRSGLSVYGLWPSSSLRAHAENRGHSLEPCLSWHSRIVQVKTVPAGFPIGYGRSFVTSRPTVLGLVPQGYGDGLPRSYGRGGTVLIEGKRCPILGRISMNMITVDLTDTRTRDAGAAVVIIGRQEDAVISADDHASLTGTIVYEVTTRISPLLPRRLID